MNGEKRVCLDPGHGGVKPGAVFHGLLEKDVVLSIAKAAQEELQVMDPATWVCMTRSWDQDISLEGRCQFANNMRVDCFVSIHCNADPDDDAPGMPEARGEEIWVYEGSNEGMKLAQALQLWVDNIFPNEPFRGIKTTTGLYVLKHTVAPACLIEVGFIDKSSSTETFTDDATIQKIGRLIAGGIHDYLASIS